MHKFVRNLLTEWRKLDLPFADQTMIVAVSGGADSVSLVLALHELMERNKLQLRFVVAHFNHHLRGVESEKDSGFVQGIAEKLNLEFFTNLDHPLTKLQNQKGNLEQNARLARYAFLTEVAEKCGAEAILIGHTKNDQAETLILNLIRGSGLDGLSGMKAVRKADPKSKIKVIRPLLNWAKREDTEMFCLDYKVKFMDDAMNEDLKFVRVKIRKEIIPMLKKINPKIVETLSQTANLLGEQSAELEKNGLYFSENLSQNEFKKLSKSMRMRVLRHWLAGHRGDLRALDLKHLDSIERLILSPKSGREVELPNGEKVIKKEGKVFFGKTEVEKS